MRQPPPPLIRLSTGAGAVVGGPAAAAAAAARNDSRDERQQAPWVAQYTPSVQTSSIPPVTPHCSPQSNNTTPSPQSEPATAVTIATLDPSSPYTPRQIKSPVVIVAATTGDNTIITATTTASVFPSPGAPLFASVVNNMMFRMGTKSRSPRRAASSSSSSALSTISAPTSAPSIITSKPGSPTSSYSASMVVPDPLQRPFSPWGSSDSQSSTSPRNSTRMSRGTFINKRSGSPTASVGTSNTSIMASRSKSFLGRNRKQQQQQQADTEFDPTTFRKNRTRPARKGQDALYGEYEDLFDDSLDEDLNEDSLPSDGGGDTDEDGYLMLRRKNGNGGGGCGGEESPVSPRSRVTPRSVPMQDDMRYNGSLSPPPPAPPPKNWTQKRSLVVVTTPPRSAPASVDEPLTISVTSLPSAPPTPPPKPILFALDTKNLTITTIHNGNSNNYNHNHNTLTPSSSLSSAREPEETNGTSPASSNPPPHRPPPDAPTSAAAVEKNRSKRLSRQFLEQAEKNDGLGIIRIPSPTLFHSLFTPGASSSSWSELPDHATRSPALTHSPSSYTPRQPPPPTTAYETLPSDDDFIPTGILFDETPDGLGVLPLFSSRSENFSPRHHSNNNHQHYNNNSDSYFPPQTPQMTQVILNELPPESPGDVSASTSKSIETLMDTYMETTDTYKEVQIRVAEDDKDAKEAILQSLAPEVVTASMMPTPAEEKILLLDEQQDDATKDSSYLRAFRTFVKSAGENDSFVHRMPRFDALQAQRICSHLRQDYPLIAGGSKRRSAGGKAAGGNVFAKHREVGEEILTSLWALMALRWMNFGRVIISPGHETLLAASAKRLTRRATVKMDQRATQMLENVVVEGSVPDHERRRVLDLGGLPIADWGWHCAYDYPKAKVYTVTTRTHGKSSAEDPESQDTPLSADKYRGPKNHRHLVVSNLWKLPFPSNHFDVVSARTLYLNLKTTVPSRLQNGQNMDEYDLCLEECLRVLKPGGHLEFTLFDNDIINPGPLGSELSEKFGKSLQAKGYDPEPTKKWISRLNRAGYGEIKRSWMFLPMAPPCSKPKVPSKDGNLPAHESQDLDLAKEEVRKKIEAWEEGSTKKGSLENASPITGLVGSWIWEKWMLKTSNESGEGEWSLAADTVGSVLNEAKERGSGWRTLVGWARKPLRVGQH